jgi:hypothetical protein
MTPNAHAAAALAIYEHLLAERPHEVHQPLSEAARHVVDLRDALISRRRRGEGIDDDLAAANVLASLAFSCQFPIAGVKWSRMETVRDALQAFCDRSAH